MGLILMEANDNHIEEHTVGEFIAWCLHGRDEGKGAGEWKSKGTGKYLEGGKAAGGQLTDQRFACRILEGELRFNMVNTVCLGVIHKVPAPGGMSAVGGTGSEYFYYDNGVISDEKLGTAEFTAYVQKVIFIVVLPMMGRKRSKKEHTIRKRSPLISKL